MEQAKQRKPKTVTEKSLLADLAKVKNIEGFNSDYYEYWATNSGKPSATQTQYKSALGRLTRYLGTDRDILTLLPSEIEEYLNNNFEEGNTKTNQGRFINAFLLYTISSDITRAVERCNKVTLMNMIPSEYHGLVSVLIAKGDE